MTDRVARIGERLAERRLRLGVAESCTGGMLTARLTDLPGASRFLVAGLTTYSDDAKTRLLGVRPETLAAHGAVSEAVVQEMVDGARRILGTEAAVAITGVAGPGGGTPAKPVGTVWIAAAAGTISQVEACRFSGDRAAVRAAAVERGLELLDRILGGES